LSPVKFNIALGIVSLISLFFGNINWLQAVPLWVLGLFFTFLYIADCWAFLLKIRIARIRQIVDVTKGEIKTRNFVPEDPGCMIMYAFIMRLVIRFSFMLLALFSFSGDLSGDLPNWAIVFVILVTLFEVFNLMYSMFETRIFKMNKENDSEKEDDKYWEEEFKWREKSLKILNDPRTPLKEAFAVIVLLLTGFVTTIAFWDQANGDFVSFIVQSSREGESPYFVVPMILISSFVLCLFFLIPVRLAFWVEEYLKADEKHEKRKYRWSILFAGVMITGPTLLQLIKSYVL